MLDVFSAFLAELAASFRWTDAVDILVVSVVVYAVLSWLRRAASRGLVIAAAGLAGLYIAARSLDLYLTTLAFQTSFAALLLALVVVFQQDLRRLVDQLASWRRSPWAPSASADSTLQDDLVETVFRLAASRVGALIVLPGREPYDRHVHAGVSLRGQYSSDILYSIFDSGSAGHDGAVVLADDVIDSFAVHLPISKNRRQLGSRGTRHSAALGLSECCDALVIAVSEERGTVSLAENGTLAPAATAAELRARLERFVADRSSTGSAGSRVAKSPINTRLAIGSFGLAVIAWLTLAYDPTSVQRTFVTPIEYRLPNDLVLDANLAAQEAKITLSGLERSFRLLDPGSLKITLDLTDARAGAQEIYMDERLIRVPRGLAIYDIEPRVLRLRLRKKNGEGPN